MWSRDPPKFKRQNDQQQAAKQHGKPEEIEQLERWFKRIDTDGDKKLTLEELKTALEKQQPKKSAKKKFQPKLLKAAEEK